LFPDIRMAFLANVAADICGGDPNRAEGQHSEAQKANSRHWYLCLLVLVACAVRFESIGR
jgi:hypothetical protein